MWRHARGPLAALAVVLLVAGHAAPAQAQFRTDKEHAPVALDAIVLRPVGFAFALASTALFVPAAAVTLAVRPSEVDRTYDAMVRRPFGYVFSDPLGEH